MLAKTVRKNLTDINNLKMRTRATKYSNMFSSEPTAHHMPITDNDYNNLDFEEISENKNVTLDEITDYIVENPQEVIVEFPLKSTVEMSEKLPFFKSISYKLANA
jgi:hypothetical protein